MPFFPVDVENQHDLHLYYEDLGTGKPVVLVHGWPLNGASWEKQTAMLLAAGFRVITYDRRGFGRSDKPSSGYDYNTMARDLDKLLSFLDIRDAALVGFSMGGGEVARYLGQYDQGRITKCCFMASIAPALRKSGDNLEGVDSSVFEGIKQGIEKDRFAFLEGFLHNFYNKKLVGGTDISDEAIRASFSVGVQSSYVAFISCVDAWLEDLRDDLKQIKIPTLVIHGDSDQILPLAATGARVPALIPGAKLHVVEGGPHGLNWTHATEVNKVLLEFLTA